MISAEDVARARKVLEGVVHRTPLDPSTSLSELTGADVWLKLENLQRTGSFKIRGAYAKIASLDEAARARGVVAASAGNHAQGVALGAKLAGTQATIVMPRHAPLTKAQAVQGYGAELILHGRDYAEAEAKAREVCDERGATFVHAFNDELVMAGQGTVGLEILEDVPDADVLVVPIGGGGLVSGIATAVKAERPDVRVVGVVPSGAASLPESLKKGSLVTLEKVGTIADGLATRSVGDRTFEVIRERVDDVIVVEDDEIAMAILHLLERSKTVAEGAGAAGLAALLAGKVPDVKGKKVVCVVSGGNIDVTLLDHIIQRGLAATGRAVEFATVVEDKPGALRDLLALLADLGANVEAIEHDRARIDVAVGKAMVRVKVGTRGSDHAEALLKALRDRGYAVR